MTTQYGYVFSLVKEWTRENIVTVSVMTLIIYQNFLENNPNSFPKYILYNPYFPYIAYVVFIVLACNVLYPEAKYVFGILKNVKQTSNSAIQYHIRIRPRFNYDGIIRWFHFVFDLFSILVFLLVIYPIVAETVTEDLRKAMIFADFYGLVIVPYIVSIHFGIKKMKRRLN